MHLHSILSEPDGPQTPQQAYQQIPVALSAAAAQHEMTRQITIFLSHTSLPVDVRHNAKINREQLAAWAAERVGTTHATHNAGISSSQARRGDER
jgi:hypothetical protein